MRWVALAVTFALWLATWPQILPPEADLPPCHMMLLIALAGAWTLHEFAKVGRNRRRRERERLWLIQHNRCTRCARDLTGDEGEVCPKCGERKPHHAAPGGSGR